MMKRQPIEWELSLSITQQKVLSRKNIKVLQIIMKRPEKPIEKWAKDLARQFRKHNIQNGY